MALFKNEKGTVIYKEPNYECEFCIPPMRKMSDFCTCLNPLLNYEYKRLGKWVIGCPQVGVETCDFIIKLDGDDFDLIFLFVEANDDGSRWMAIDKETYDEVVKDLSINNNDYFLWLMKSMGWQVFPDTDGLDCEEDETLFTKDYIPISSSTARLVGDEDE